MGVLLYAGTKRALAPRHQDLIRLHKLRCEQTVKRIFEMDLKRASFCTLLSHAFVACRETLAARG
jgi:hypothetical protein